MVMIGKEDIRKRTPPCIHLLGCPEDEPQHLMGVDGNVRDVFSRLVYGTRISLVVGFITVGFAIIAGTVLGALAGYIGGWVDNGVMRFMDVLLAFPFLLLTISITSALRSLFTNNEELENAFRFDETPDQLRAIDEVKADMESERPMDRLICGDVGYGKTEVAIRAAFKAALDNRQVAVLVPTTILAQQHYNTFQERLARYPLEIAMLSRFRTEEERARTVRGLKEGTADIVVGTHRLLSGDVGFKNLGLVIVDEEQRFGVKQKERLRRLRTEVDVISLSATPIPRTLNMALSGIRQGEGRPGHVAVRVAAAWGNAHFIDANIIPSIGIGHHRTRCHVVQTGAIRGQLRIRSGRGTIAGILARTGFGIVVAAGVHHHDHANHQKTFSPKHPVSPFMKERPVL